MQLNSNSHVYYLPLVFTDKSVRTITCWLPIKKNSRKDVDEYAFRTSQSTRGGYYQMNGGVDVHVHMHEAHKPGTVMENNARYHVSHLCHHWWCCNPQHLHKEPDWVNIFRKGCTLDCDGGHCDCSSVTHPRFASHPIPPCIWYNSLSIKRNPSLFIDEESTMGLIYVIFNKMRKTFPSKKKAKKEPSEIFKSAQELYSTIVLIVDN